MSANEKWSMIIILGWVLIFPFTSLFAGMVQGLFLSPTPLLPLQTIGGRLVLVWAGVNAFAVGVGLLWWAAHP